MTIPVFGISEFRTICIFISLELSHVDVYCALIFMHIILTREERSQLCLVFCLDLLRFDTGRSGPVNVQPTYSLMIGHSFTRNECLSQYTIVGPVRFHYWRQNTSLFTLLKYSGVKNGLIFFGLQTRL